MRANPEEYDGYIEPPPFNAEEPPSEGPIGHWDERMTDFQKLIMVKVFLEEKVSSTIEIILVIILVCCRLCLQLLILSATTWVLSL